jgi:hypothetical protein
MFNARLVDHRTTAGNATNILKFHIAILKERCDEDSQVKRGVGMTCTRRMIIREAKAQVATPITCGG